MSGTGQYGFRPIVGRTGRHVEHALQLVPTDMMQMTQPEEEEKKQRRTFGTRRTIASVAARLSRVQGRARARGSSPISSPCVYAHRSPKDCIFCICNSFRTTACPTNDRAPVCRASALNRANEGARRRQTNAIAGSDVVFFVPRSRDDDESAPPVRRGEKIACRERGPNARSDEKPRAADVALSLSSHRSKTGPWDTRRPASAIRARRSRADRELRRETGAAAHTATGERWQWKCQPARVRRVRVCVCVCACDLASRGSPPPRRA